VETEKETAARPRATRDSARASPKKFAKSPKSQTARAVVPETNASAAAELAFARRVRLLCVPCAPATAAGGSPGAPASATARASPGRRRGDAAKARSRAFRASRVAARRDAEAVTLGTRQSRCRSDGILFASIRRCRRWRPGRDAACRADRARRGNGDGTASVVRRDARRERASDASTPTRASPARKPSGSDALPAGRKSLRFGNHRAGRVRARASSASVAEGERGHAPGGRSHGHGGGHLTDW
jgi:hypothetical protein